MSLVTRGYGSNTIVTRGYGGRVGIIAIIGQGLIALKASIKKVVDLITEY